MIREHGFNFGYWAFADGTSYWGIQMPRTVEIGQSIHRLEKACKARLIAWQFGE